MCWFKCKSKNKVEDKIVDPVPIKEEPKYVYFSHLSDLLKAIGVDDILREKDNVFKEMHILVYNKPIKIDDNKSICIGQTHYSMFHLSGIKVTITSGTVSREENIMAPNWEDIFTKYSKVTDSYACMYTFSYKFEEEYFNSDDFKEKQEALCLAYKYVRKIKKLCDFIKSLDSYKELKAQHDELKHKMDSIFEKEEI